MCFKAGVMKEVEQVHHKLPLNEGGTHDINNLISLCQSCHSRIHAERGDRWNNKK
ncbi:HNH endonuclease signature motif containing protein [Ligilactobacillus ceti]|uniref:HNH endonuclease signature motif containing protein n=1 Tax=Ligilactobacillus ceti TaxID=395085 RepID=UPI0030846693